jgi:hypothetical protein
MRALLVMVAVRLLGMGRRSGGGRLSSDAGVEVPFCGTGGVLSAKSRSQFGSRSTSSGIGSRPSGRGYCSRRHWRSATDQGTKEPSILGWIRIKECKFAIDKKEVIEMMTKLEVIRRKVFLISQVLGTRYEIEQEK